MCLYTNSSIKQYGLHIIAVDPITLLTFSFIWELEDFLKIKILMMSFEVRKSEFVGRIVVYQIDKL